MSQQINLVRDATQSRKKPHAIRRCDQQGVTTTFMGGCQDRMRNNSCFESTLSQRAPFLGITEKKLEAWDESPLLRGVASLRGLSHPFPMRKRSGSQGRKDATGIIMAKEC